MAHVPPICCVWLRARPCASRGPLPCGCCARRAGVLSVVLDRVSGAEMTPSGTNAAVMRHCGNVLMCGVYCGVKWPGVAQRASSPFFGALLPPGMAVRGKQGLVGTPEPPTNVQPPINNVPPCLKLHYGPTQGPVHVVIMTTLLQPAYITSDQIGHSASRPTESRTGGGGAG